MTDFTDDLAVGTSNVKFKLADPLGRPIGALKYEVRQAGRIIGQGATDAEGDSAQFQALIGLPISIAVQRFMGSGMKVIREVTPWTEIFPIVLVSGKVLEKTETSEDAGSPGQYRRKTCVVQDGDTLAGVAAAQGCDPGELAELNEIDADAPISDGQILKLPLATAAGAGGGSAPVSGDAASAPTPSDPGASNDGGSAGDAGGPDDVPGDDATASAAPTPAPLPASAPPAPAVPTAAPRPAPHAAPVAAPHPPGAPPAHPTPPPAPRPPAPAPAPAPGVVEIVMSRLESAWTSLVDEVRGVTGTPKAVAGLKCPGVCLKVGDKGLLVEELNLRLTGFGGTVLAPAALDEFTSKTEAAVRQFQRDFMKVPETGKVCGSFLVALDLFVQQYPIDFAKLRCACGRCGGFGTGQTSSQAAGMFQDPPRNQHPWAGVERPGLHRAIGWAMRAALHYTTIVEKDLQYKFLRVSSSYRCWYDNSDAAHHDDHKVRHTVNHMGDALDVQFTKGSSPTRCQGEAVDTLRAKVFVSHMGAQMAWGQPNRVSLERASDGAGSWVHMDVRTYAEPYKLARYYAVNQATFDGDGMVEIAKREARLPLTACRGLSPSDVPVGPPKGVATAPTATSKGAAAPNAPRTPGAPAPGTAPAAVQPIAGTRTAIASLAISAAGLSFIGGFEHCKLEPYDDSKGFATIGWGHLIVRKSCAAARHDPEFQDFKDGIDQAEADRLFRRDVGKTEKMVKSRVQVPMFQHEYDALVSLIFSMGSFDKCPQLLSKLNTKNYVGCCHEFADITNGGTAGLVTRRNAEMDVFTNSVYNSKH